MSAQQPMRGDADIAPIGALIGDPTRARVLMALLDGRALPASRLAAEAGVAASTVSEHLARLLAAELVTMQPEGRSRFYRLSSAAVADALEALARIAPEQPIRSLRQGSHARALREARTCYNHLAGRLGTGLLIGFLDGGVLAGGDGRHHPDRAVHDRLSAPGRDLSYRLTPHGEDVLGQLGIDLDRVLARRPAVRYCLDWSEQRHHLAGPLGTALAGRLFALGWVRRTQRRRVVQVTELGRLELPQVLGLPAGWAQPAAAEEAWHSHQAASSPGPVNTTGWARRPARHWRYAGAACAGWGPGWRWAGCGHGGGAGVSPPGWPGPWPRPYRTSARWSAGPRRGRA